jgi:hypothetical protein
MILNIRKLARRASAWMREVMVQRRWENILCMCAHRFDVRNRYLKFHGFLGSNIPFKRVTRVFYVWQNGWIITLCLAREKIRFFH